MMVKVFNAFFLAILLIYSSSLFAREVVVRFVQPVAVQEKTSAAGKTYASDNAAIQQVLAQFSPQNISRKFAQQQKALPEPLKYVQVWRLSPEKDVDALIRALQVLPMVAYAERNATLRVFGEPDDPLISEQWHLPAINAFAAWDREVGNPLVIVGVIDTGIDYRHEDLQGQFWINSAEDLNTNGVRDSLDFNGVDDDDNGYIDDVIGWDFTDAPDFPDGGDFRDPDNDPMDEFGSGHGTPVAGIIAARQNNRLGVSGIAPGARVMALRAGTASGFLEADDVAEAIVYAVENGCQIVNMSFGDAAQSYLIRDAIQYGVSRGVMFVAASGNSGNPIPNYPAAFDETISVGAIDSSRSLAGFSSYGGKLNLVAPGVNVFSTLIDDNYGTASGTSFATPMISAALALIRSQHPEYAPEQVMGALYAGCNDLGLTGWDHFFGHGLIDLQNILHVSEQGYSEIIAPANGSGISVDEIAIIGTAFSPNILSYSVGFAAGENPLIVNPIAEVTGKQVLRDTLAMWNMRGLPDSVYTLEARLRQRDLSDVVFRSTIFIDHTAPVAGDVSLAEVVAGTVNGYLIRFETDDPTLATLQFGRAGEEPFSRSKISRYFQKDHHFILTADDLSGAVAFYFDLENAAGLASQLTDNGDPFSIEIADIPFSEDLLTEKRVLSSAGYLMPTVTDFNGNQIPEFVFSELVNGVQFGGVRLGEIIDGAYLQTELTGFPAIPRDAGQIHPGDGLSLAAGLENHSLLLAGNMPGETPKAIVWEDTTNFWASRLQNYDDDPALEMLAINFGEWRIFDIDETGQPSFKQALPAATDGNNQFGVPWSLLTDLDGDGQREIVFEDLDGDVSLYEADVAGNYQFAWSARMPGKGGGSLLQAADVDGDGQDELISAVRNQPDVLRESNVNTQFWALTIWKSAGDNQFEQIARKNFLGVTSQTGVFNGLSVADLDGDGASEIIFTPFPRAYVLGLSGNDVTIRWFAENINSNSALAADFDNDGQTDVLLNTTEGITQFEMITPVDQPLPPARLQATPLDTSRIRLDWVRIGNAEKFRIYRKTSSDVNFMLLDSSVTAVYLDTRVENGNVYTYVVTQIDPSFPIPESRYSRPGTAQPNAPPELTGLEVLTPRQLLLRFSEPMGASAFVTHHYQVLPGAQPPLSAIRGENRREILLSFQHAFPDGENNLQLFQLFDAQHTPMGDDSLSMRFELIPAAGAFYLESATLVDKSHLQLRFNRPVEQVSGENPANYRMEPFVAVNGAQVNSLDARIVQLILDKANRLGSLGVPHFLSVKNVRSVSGEPVDSSTANRLAITGAVETLDDVVVFPNPYNARIALDPLTFGNLPPESEILIFNSSGRKIRQIRQPVRSGGISWDLQTDDGKPVGSGVYIYVIQSQGSEKTGKILVIK